MNDTTAPARGIAVGSKIEHDLMPGFAMTVKAAEPCETDGARPEEHAKYLITDPEGNEDWLCAYDVHAAHDPAGTRMAETWLHGPRDMPLTEDGT